MSPPHLFAEYLLQMMVCDSPFPDALAPASTSTSTPAKPRPASPAVIDFPINIAILDDHPIVSASISRLLQGHTDLRVRHSEIGVEAMLGYLLNRSCDLLLLDYHLPDDRWDGSRLIKRIRRAHPEISIVCLSAGNVSETRDAAFRAGANGFISKSDSVKTMLSVMRRTMKAPAAFFYGVDNVICSGAPPAAVDALSLGEKEVLRLIAAGYSVSELAEKLIRSKKTISAHKRRAMRKLGLIDDTALALYLQSKYKTLS